MKEYTNFKIEWKDFIPFYWVYLIFKIKRGNK